MPPNNKRFKVFGFPHGETSVRRFRAVLVLGHREKQPSQTPEHWFSCSVVMFVAAEVASVCLRGS